MRTILYFATTVAVVTASAIIIPEQESQTKEGGMPSPNLILLGSVDHKRYYVDLEHMYWLKAMDHCNAFGQFYGLATITSKIQMDYLIQALEEAGYSDDFWTAGRDVIGPSQYLWDHSEEQVNPVVNLQASPSWQTCLVVRPAPNNGTKVYGVHCDKMVAVLCEEFCGIDC